MLSLSASDLDLSFEPTPNDSLLLLESASSAPQACMALTSLRWDMRHAPCESLLLDPAFDLALAQQREELRQSLASSSPSSQGPGARDKLAATVCRESNLARAAGQKAAADLDKEVESMRARREKREQQSQREQQARLDLAKASKPVAQPPAAAPPEPAPNPAVLVASAALQAGLSSGDAAALHRAVTAADQLGSVFTDTPMLSTGRRVLLEARVSAQTQLQQAIASHHQPQLAAVLGNLAAQLATGSEWLGVDLTALLRSARALSSALAGAAAHLREAMQRGMTQGSAEEIRGAIEAAKAAGLTEDDPAMVEAAAAGQSINAAVSSAAGAPTGAATSGATTGEHHCRFKQHCPPHISTAV